jgi:hypothetical protein
MKRFLLAILCAGIALAGSASHGEQAMENDIPRIRCDGHHLMFGWHGGTPHRVDVSNLIRAATLESARVLAAERIGDFTYFVVSVSGPTQLGQPGGSTFSGTESNLLWLKLKSWKLLDSQSVLYQSFLYSMAPVGDYHFRGGVLTMRYESRRDNIGYLLRYDSARPDDKLVIQRLSDVE